jgi:hypothetical protein
VAVPLRTAGWYHRDVRRFHQPNGLVLGYDETAFPREVVQRVRDAWKALLPARTMQFLRADAHAPASVLLSLGAFRDVTELRSLLDLLRSEAARPAREALCQLFRACSKPHPEFQLRWDVGSVILRARFVPSRPSEVGTALESLPDLARSLEDAGLPSGTTVVVASYRGGWELEAAHGFDPAAGRVRVYRYREGRWTAHGGR